MGFVFVDTLYRNCNKNFPRRKVERAYAGRAFLTVMLIGELPSEADVSDLTSSWQRRSHVPNHVFEAIDALPVTAHPMTMFVTGIMALQTESNFAKRYAEGMNKKDYWDAVFDDSMDLIARLRG